MALKESVERTRRLNLLDMEAKTHYRYWTTSANEVRHFRVPLDKIKTGDNALCVETRDTPRSIEFIAVELAVCRLR